MIYIPLPMVLSLLLMLVAALIYLRRPESGKPVCGFVLVCAVSLSLVGLRWSLDIALLRFLQPAVAALIPVLAWCCFVPAHRAGSVSWWHFSGPATVLLGSFIYPWWPWPIDVALVGLSLVYGVALWRLSTQPAAYVRLEDSRWFVLNERLGAGLLLFSALVDALLAIDFAVFSGEHVLTIVSAAHLMMLPALVAVVILASRTMPSLTVLSPDNFTDPEPLPLAAENDDDARCQIVARLDDLMCEHKWYLDTDLTLDRLARKMMIPARQISRAVNHVHGENLSRFVNRYRVEHAKTLLITTDQSVTEIYLSAGFQTKSNFNREFARLTGVTPSAFRRQGRDSCSSLQ